MAVIKPPITGDPTLDSWTNQITQTMNAGVTTGSSPSVGARGSAGASGFNTATISLFARTTTNSAPSAVDEQLTYTYSTAQLVNGSNHDGYTNGIGPSDVWFRKVNAGSGDFVWTTTVSVADTNDVEIIAADSWSAVALLSTSGENIKNKVFVQDNVPTALQVGDLWIDTNDNLKVYIAKSIGANEVASNEWVLAQDSVAAQARADLAMSQLSDIAADDKVTPSEKLPVKTLWDAIRGEYAGIIASAVDSGVATNHAKYTAYTTAYANLTTYLVSGTGSINLFNSNGTLNGPTNTHTIVRSTWDSTFKAYYDSRQGLLDFIAATLKDLADLALTKLSDIAADDKITHVEKLIVKTIWDAIRGEQAGIKASAVDAGIATTHAKYTAYNGAYNNLYTYLVAGSGSTNIFQGAAYGGTEGQINSTNTTTITRATWNARFESYYTTKQELLDFIAATLKDFSETKANVFYQDASPIPTALKVGDLWYNLDQTFNGTPNVYIAQSVGANEIATNEWVRKDFVELINNNTTTINGGHISTGSITTAHIDTGGINADKLNINGQLIFGEGGAYKFGKSTPQDETDGIFIGNPSGTSNYSISYEGGNANAGTASSVRSLFADENTFELKNPTIKTGTTTTEVVYRQTGSTSNVTIPSAAQTLTVIAVGGGGGGGSGQSDTSNTNVANVVGVQGGTTSASIDNSLANVSAAGGAGGLSGSNISAGSGTGISGEYGTGGSQGSAGNTGGAGGNASGFGAGGGGSGSRNYGGFFNQGQDAVTNGGGGQAGTVNISGPHDVSSLGAITISSISIGAGGAGGDGNAAGAGGTGSAGRLIVTYTETNLTSVHLLTTAEKTTIDNSIKKYESSHTSVSNNQLLTFAHSLGAVPSFVTVDAIAKTSNSNGWSNGDRIQINQSADPSGQNEGLGIRTDSTNVYITIGANGPGMVTFRSNGAGTILTASLWNIQVKAFLVG